MRGAWRAGFLKCLAQSGVESRCADFADVSRQHVFRTKHRDPQFAQAVSAALAAYERSRVDDSLSRQRRHAACFE